MNPKWKKPRAKKSKKAPVARLSKPMKKAVVKLIEGRAEKKVAITTQLNSPSYDFALVSGPINGYNTDRSSFIPLLPSVGQGVTRGERIGDTIRPTGLYLDLILRITGFNVNSLNTHARVLVLSDKGIKNYTQMATTNVYYGSLLLEQSTTTQYTADPGDNLSPINKEQFIVHHDKLIHLSKTQGQNDSGTLVPIAGSMVSASSYIQRLRLKIPCPKTLKYERDSDVFPSNFAPLLCIGYSNMDGTVFSPNLVSFIYNVTMYYEDS